MSEMVERVELVLHDFLQGEMTIPEAARAAIEAMREPTEAMVDPLDLDAIEKEARAYIEAYRLEPLPTRRYLVGLLKVIDELRATIRERDAEIARLRDVERRHLGWCDTCQVYHAMTKPLDIDLIGGESK